MGLSDYEIKGRGYLRATPRFNEAETKYPIQHKRGYPMAFMAERGGFEPPMGFRPYRFSRPAHSTTLPPLL